MGADMNRKDLLLAFLLAEGSSGVNEPIIGTTRFEKLVWLFLSDAQIQPSIYEFLPDNYGPYSPQMADDLEFLRNLGLVDVKDPRVDPAYGPPSEDAAMPVRYSLTPIGEDIAKAATKDISSTDWKRIDQIKKKFNRMPFDDLLKAVYRAAPQSMLTKSIVRDRYLKWEQ